MTPGQPPDDEPAQRDRPYLGGPDPVAEFGRLFDAYVDTGEFVGTREFSESVSTAVIDGQGQTPR
ncbi:hypothetical protein [Actinophytocola sediminis]